MGHDEGLALVAFVFHVFSDAAGRTCSTLSRRVHQVCCWRMNHLNSVYRKYMEAWCPVGFTPQAAMLFGLSVDWLNLWSNRPEGSVATPEQLCLMPYFDEHHLLKCFFH